MEARFLAKVNKIEGGCWVWIGEKFDDTEYGKFTIATRNFGAHRIAYELWIGEILSEQVVRHKCDNPSCVNPAHLETGTQQDNMNDKLERGRQPRGEGHCNSKLTEDNVVEIKILLGFGVPATHIVKQFGVSASTIYHIKTGKTWAHVTPASRAQSHPQLQAAPPERVCAGPTRMVYSRPQV